LAAEATIPLDVFDPSLDPSWTRYAAGIIYESRRLGIAATGVNAIVGGDLPIGAGLSSSAAFEVALALVLQTLAGASLSARETALLCWKAENEFVGVPSGIMDQFASALCSWGNALFLDCRSRETHHLPLGENIVLSVCDTGTRRTVATSAYRVRREECAAAVSALRNNGREIQSLRDLDLADLALVDRLPSPLNRRARHVVTENARVLEVTRSLMSGTPATAKDIFIRSHWSLRDDYEVSAPELDAMVESALASPGCLAARMTGAGFGGAIVALVDARQQDAFVHVAADAYRRKTGTDGRFFVTQPVDGAKVLSSEDLALEG
jgi:galactokinase